MTEELYGNIDREEERRQARLRLLGTSSPRCCVPGCRERDPFALTGVHPRLLCAEHRAHIEGRSPLEAHHPAGRQNAPSDTVQLPANDHSALTHGYQAAWPRDTLRNPDGSPLLRAAASIRGWLDVLRLILERTCGWVPGFLERLDAWLCFKMGEDWWAQFAGWSGFDE
jgi:hypothetical protein